MRNVKNDNISLDDICYLVSETIVQDKIGNEISMTSERQVFCAELPIFSSEFSNAGQLGIKPSFVLVIDSEEYQQNEMVNYHEEVFSIYKTFKREDGLIELYCSKKTGLN